MIFHWTTKDYKRADPYRFVSSGICYCGEEYESCSKTYWEYLDHPPTERPEIERDWITAWFCWFMGMSAK